MIANTPNIDQSRTNLSVISSKSQTPLKSPQPDQSRMNILTPTKLKYLTSVQGFDLAEGLNINNYHRTPNKNDKQYFTHEPVDYQRYQSTKQKYERQQNSEIEKVSEQYLSSLHQQIQVLKIENKNLLKKLTAQENSQYESSKKRTQQSGQQFTSSKRRQSTHLIIQKIKQQYEQKLNTLKIMIQQQIKEAMDVVEDMCDILRQKMKQIEQKVQKVQNKVGEIKIDKIMKVDHALNQAGRIYGHRGFAVNSPNRSPGRDENSISDILCVSIPEQQQQQSKNETITILKLQQEIQSLRKTINQTEHVYQRQKSMQERQRQSLESMYNKQRECLQGLIQKKDQQICVLNQKIMKIDNKKFIDDNRFNEQIKKELFFLQANVRELNQQIANYQHEYSTLLYALQAKNQEVQSFNNQIGILKDKVYDSQKNRILLLEKIKYLEGNVQLLQRELKEKKKQINSVIISKYELQKSKISKNISQTFIKKTQNNVLSLTSRIDKLLLLEEQREIQEKSLIQSTIQQFSYIADLQ